MQSARISQLSLDVCAAVLRTNIPTNPTRPMNFLNIPLFAPAAQRLHAKSADIFHIFRLYLAKFTIFCKNTQHLRYTLYRYPALFFHFLAPVSLDFPAVCSQIYNILLRTVSPAFHAQKSRRAYALPQLLSVWFSCPVFLISLCAAAVHRTIQCSSAGIFSAACRHFW